CVARLVREANEAVQRADLRVQRAVQGLGRGGAVERENQGLAEPRLLRQRIALRALLDLDVLLLQAQMRLDPQTGLTLQVGEGQLRRRIDRVYLAATDRLNLRVR